MQVEKTMSPYKFHFISFPILNTGIKVKVLQSGIRRNVALSLIKFWRSEKMEKENISVWEILMRS